MMTKEDFKDRLMSLQDITHALFMTNGVYSDTALYGFLAAANGAIHCAILHIDEFKSTKDDDKDEQ